MPNEMRDRLIELLDAAPTDYAGNRNVGVIADHLLANGVILPPCAEQALAERMSEE